MRNQPKIELPHADNHLKRSNTLYSKIKMLRHRIADKDEA